MFLNCDVVYMQVLLLSMVMYIFMCVGERGWGREGGCVDVWVG